MKIKTNPLSIYEIAKFSQIFRSQYNIKNDQFFPIMEVIDKMVDEELLVYQIVEEDYFEDNTIFAMYDSGENCIFIKESVIDDYENSIYRANFTLAHELFHYIQCKVLNFTFNEVEDCKAYESVEWQANEFACQLLIPNEYLYLDVLELSNRYHVSEECAYYAKVKAKRRKK